ncbi:hypothetical protein HNQ07_001753 [Deinococcus metalli]|uniref:Uncharacterized protein n=1 Tax=Deinococcus metalli TaxID=1141878 RepID=A0A7W8NP00_9DEIO|nr:hypothetical protein [Deinococcus metalli]MBB5376296.1 hypothetical protein [Deinococcus metalli]GHF39376.1 hypothetical protein GCM10017781_14870 [Deinococcus metalli]
MRAAFFLSPLLLLGGLTLAAQGSAALPPALASGWQVRLASMLPVPGQPADVMQRQPNISVVNLSIRVANAQGDREALSKVISDVQSGVRPTYDKRLGITEQEFARYVVFQTVLKPSGRRVRLPVTRDVSRVVFGDTPDLNGVLKGVSIDLKTGEMHGPEGYSARPVNVPASTETDGALKVTTGFMWKVIGNDARAGNGVRGTLNLLQLEDGAIILSYKRTSMIKNVLNQGEVILSYLH